MAPKPSPAEAASFTWGGQRARPRKRIERSPVTGQTYLKPPGSCQTRWPETSISVEIACCVDCTIAILDPTEQICLTDCHGCRIIVGPCLGSLSLFDCSGCSISAAARQIRLRDVTDCTLRTFAPSRGCIVLETSRDLRLGSWDVAYPGLDAQFASAGWDLQANFWSKVHDFSPPEGGGRRNYALLPRNAGLLEEQGLARWCELSLAPEGLAGGAVTCTLGPEPSVEGCECPCAAADGAYYVASWYEPPDEPLTFTLVSSAAVDDVAAAYWAEQQPAQDGWLPRLLQCCRWRCLRPSPSSPAAQTSQLV